jgi:MFS family permease
MRVDRYRWVLACNLLAILTVSSGLGFYNLSVYMNQLASQRGFSIAAASNAVGVFFLSSGIAALGVGRVLQRRDARLVMLVGTAIAAVSVACIGWIREFWQLYLVYVLFGVGYACVSVLPATTLITRWFDASTRPLALSLSTTGLSLGGVVLTPISALLFSRLPLETATALLGAIMAVSIAPLVWFGVRSFPDSSSAASPSQARLGMAYGHAVRSRFFVVLTAGYLLVLGTQVGGIAHMYNRGVAIASPLEASFAVSVLATLSVVGRLLGGVIIGRIPIKAFALTNVAGQLFGFVVLGHATDAWQLWIGAGLFGFTVGNLLMLQPLILAQAFGVADYPRIYSTSQAVTTLGVASGPVLLGAITATSGYLVAFSVFAVLSAAAFGLIVAAGPVPVGDGAVASSAADVA